MGRKPQRPGSSGIRVRRRPPRGMVGPHPGTASLASLLHLPIASLGRLFSLVLS